MAKASPGEFFRQVRAEASKVVWPTRKETVTTAIMVLIMTAMLAAFFFGVDAFFNVIVKFLLGLLG
jgi:preprotein translocase subunit SecE